MTPVLDDQAREVLRTLRPGDHFTLRNQNGTYQAVQWFHPVEEEPYVRAVENYNDATRFIRVSRIDAVVSKRSP